MNDDIALRNARAYGFLDALLNISDRSVRGEFNKLSPGLTKLARAIVAEEEEQKAA